MDPGTALGVVSLGLQVCEGLFDYYQAWDGYFDDIRETCDRIADLNKTLTLLRDGLHAIQTTSPSVTLASRVAECLTNCEDGITRLDNRLKKLHKETPKGFRQKAQAGGLRLIYPFRKSTLEKCKEDVQELKQDLGLAIQALQLGNAGETLNTVNRVEDKVDVIEDLTARIDSTTLETQIQLQATTDGVRALLTEQEAELLRKILQWLSAPDPTINHEEARKKYEPGTGEWLLQSQEYQDWVLGHSPRLWLHGKAGCCKTVLCSTIIEDVLRRLSGQQKSVCAYFYFSFADMQKQSYVSLLLSMVTELSRGCAVHPTLLAVYQKCQPNNKPTASMLEQVLVALLQQGNTSYLIVDALDECPESEAQREQIMEGLRRVTEQTIDTRLLITSRREEDIEDVMLPWCEVRLAVDEESVNADIDIFVKNSLSTDKKLLRLPAETKKEIEDVFHEKSDGMFRWAALQLDCIRNLKILRPKYISAALYTMPRTLDETYRRVLAAIDDMYDEEARTALAWLAFSERPLSLAELAEACSIRLNSDDGFVFEEGGEEAIMGLLTVISSLVLVEHGSYDQTEPEVDPADFQAYVNNPLKGKFRYVRYCQRIRLAHFSVKEYLMSSRLQDSQVSKFALLESEAHCLLGQSCCAYLLHFTNQPEIRIWIDEEKPPDSVPSGEWGGGERQDLMAHFAPAYPLLSYAVHRWNVHQAFSETHSHTPRTNSRLHLRMLEEEDVRVSWLRLVDPDGHRYGPEPDMSIYANGYETAKLKALHDDTTPLYWAALLELPKTFVSLSDPDSCPDLNHVAGRCGTAVQAAASSGLGWIVDILIRHGADINIQGGYYGNPLQAAAYFGHENIVETLISHGANVNSLAGHYMTAITAAAHCQNKNKWNTYGMIVQRLLQAGADPDIYDATNSSPGRNTQTALFAAAKAGHEEIVQMLIEAGANLNVLCKTSEGSQTALFATIDEGYEKIAEMLVQAGADVEIWGKSPYLEDTAPLLMAVQWRHGSFVQMLIEAGANVNAAGHRSREYKHPLLIAVEAGKEDIAKMLIQAGADITGERGREAFMAATKPREFTFDGTQGESIAVLLLSSGLDVHEDCQPLICSALVGSERLVAMILQSDVDIHGHGSFISCERYGGKLEYAPESGSALMAAAGSGHESLVQLLLDRGAKVNDWSDPIDKPYDTGYATALTQAVCFCIKTWSSSSTSRGLRIIRRLLDAGADIHAGGDAALYKAVQYHRNFEHDLGSNVALAQLLLANGADVNGQYRGPDNCPRSSILWGVKDIGLAQILLDHGADVNGLSYFRDVESVLFRAAAVKNKELVRFLLDSKADVDVAGVSEGIKLATAAFSIFHEHDLDSTCVTIMILDAVLDVKGRDATIIGAMLEDTEEPWHWQQHVRPIFAQLISARGVRYDSVVSAEEMARRMLKEQ